MIALVLTVAGPQLFTVFIKKKYLTSSSVLTLHPSDYLHFGDFHFSVRRGFMSEGRGARINQKEVLPLSHASFSLGERLNYKTYLSVKWE